MPLIRFSVLRLKDLLRFRKRPITISAIGKSKKARESEPDPERAERSIPANVPQASQSSAIFSFSQPSSNNNPDQSLSEFLAWSAQPSGSSTPASTPPSIATPLSLLPKRPSRPRPQSAPVPPAPARRGTARRSAAPPFVARGPESPQRAVSAGTEMELDRWWGDLHAQEKVAVRKVWDGVKDLLGRTWLVLNLKKGGEESLGGDTDWDRQRSLVGE